MSDFNWSAIKELFDKETETLEGGGVMVHSDGTFEPHPNNHYGELHDTLYETEDGWYYGGHHLSEDEFVENGFRYRIQHQSAVADEDFLKYWAQEVLQDYPSVFLGATAVFSEEDDLSEWFFIIKGEEV